MANFEKAYEKLALKEGGYVNDPDDCGGETYRGISRKYNTFWKGWDMIDSYKKYYTGRVFIGKLDTDTQLQRLVKEQYKRGYWDVFNLDNIPSDSVAYQMFDTNVNCGKSTAIKIAQNVVGLKPDGKWSLELFNKLKNIKE